MKLINISPEYYNFVRILRTHPENSKFFIEQVNISEQDQIKYMEKNHANYYICLLDGVPVGYTGVMNNDVTICAHPEFKNKGIGKFMLQEMKKIFPNISGRIKTDNIASRKVFDSCKIPYTLI